VSESETPQLRDRYRSAPASQRLTAVALALLVEALLVLAVLSLGLGSKPTPKPVAPNLVSVDIRSAKEETPETAKPKTGEVRQTIQQPRQLAQPVAAIPATPPKAPAFILPSNNQLATLDISKLPRTPSGSPAPGKAIMGPANFSVPGDSKRVGTAPNGQPMYAASWYREPYDSELSGYLSTADGPGWALITCRTAPNFRVEDCVGLDEYPTGSRMLRAVLAAAWQFEVRPPRVGGVAKVGDWVRIRIDYIERKQ
jgi:protein TonB